MVKYALPEELAHTPATVIERVYAEIIGPRVRLAKFFDEGEYHLVNTPATQSAGGPRGRLENGQTVGLAVAVFGSDDGGKSLVLQNGLFNAWQILDRHDNPRVPKDLTRLYLEGLRKDRSRLEALGASGMYCGPDRGFVTWDECERIWSERLLAKQRNADGN